MAENGNFYFFQGLLRVSKNIFVGSRFKMVKSDITIDLSGVIPPQFNLPGLGIHQTAASIGIVSERDTRNSTFYPTAGTDSGLHVDFFEPGLGSNFRYQNYDLYFNKYVGLTENQVITFRGYGCAVSGQIVPFTELCEFGSSNDIRGYEAGRYRDRLMFAIQSEYRLHLRFPQSYPRFGVVVFGGIGEVAPAFSSFRFDSLLPAGGAGLRYRLSKTFPVNFRFDVAYGRNGGTYMFSVGEAF
jgi:outer membrane protein assembly factor BamA